jgi:hypothetical protein
MHLRFSIRDLLWLTLVVALVLGWWLDHRSKQAEIDSLNGVGAFVSGPIPVTITAM